MPTTATVRALRTSDPAPSVSESFDRVVDAAQGLAVDQMRLIRLEVEATLLRMGVGVGLVLVGLVLLLSGWVTALGGLFHLLTRWMPPSAALGILTALNLALGAGVAYVGSRRLRGS